MSHLSSTMAGAFRRLALPLACYYAATLAVPIVNGARVSAAFAEHALVVLVVPPAGIVLACGLYRNAHAVARLVWAFGSRLRKA